MDAHALPSQESAQGLRERERGSFRDGVKGVERHSRKRRQRENIDDGASGASQYRYESLGYVISAKEIDGQQPFERGTIAQIILERDAGRSEEHTSELQSLRHLVCRL